MGVTIHGWPTTRPAVLHAVPRLVTPPTEEPITLEQAKLRAGLNWSPGDPRDSLMLGFISAARAKVEQDTGLVLLSTAYDLLLDTVPSGFAILLPWRPVQSVTVATFDPDDHETVLAGTDVVLDPGGQSAASRVTISPTIWPASLRTSQAWVVHLVLGFPSAEALTAAAPGLVHAVGLLAAHYATLGRDLASVDGTTAVPMGYADAISSYVPVVVA